MKVIIAGSRLIQDYHKVKDCIAKAKLAIERIESSIDVVVSGRARGVDQLGERWAHENNISIECYPADWKTHGPVAGPIRNKIMSQNADALICIWDGKSPGSKNMIKCMRLLGKPVFEYVV